MGFILKVSVVSIVLVLASGGLAFTQGSRTKTQRNKHVAFYSKINEARINVSQDSVNCLTGAVLKSFKANMPGISAKDLKVESIDLGVYPFYKDSASCDGLYIYRIHGTRNPRYENGIPYRFYAIKGDEVMFFIKRDVEGNRKKLERLKGISTYPEIAKYEAYVLENLILIK